MASRASSAATMHRHRGGLGRRQCRVFRARAPRPDRPRLEEVTGPLAGHELDEAAAGEPGQARRTVARGERRAREGRHRPAPPARRAALAGAGRAAGRRPAVIPAATARPGRRGAAPAARTAGGPRPPRASIPGGRARRARGPAGVAARRAGSPRRRAPARGAAPSPGRRGGRPSRRRRPPVAASRGRRHAGRGARGDPAGASPGSPGPAARGSARRSSARGRGRAAGGAGRRPGPARPAASPSTPSGGGRVAQDDADRAAATPLHDDRLSGLDPGEGVRNEVGPGSIAGDAGRVDGDLDVARLGRAGRGARPALRRTPRAGRAHGRQTTTRRSGLRARSARMIASIRSAVRFTWPSSLTTTWS